MLVNTLDALKRLLFMKLSDLAHILIIYIRHSNSVSVAISFEHTHTQMENKLNDVHINRTPGGLKVVKDVCEGPDGVESAKNYAPGSYIAA